MSHTLPPSTKHRSFPHEDCLRRGSTTNYQEIIPVARTK